MQCGAAESAGRSSANSREEPTRNAIARNATAEVVNKYLQTDGLMQASDELRCSGMTIGAFSFSDDGGSERPRRRTTVPDSCRETAGTVAPQAAEEGEHGTFTLFR